MNIPLGNILNNELVLLQVIAIGSSIGAIISNVEWLTLNKQFKEGGLFSWGVRKVRTLHLVHKSISKLTNQIFSYPGIIFIFVIRILLIIFLFFSYGNRLYFGAICLILVGISIILSLRGNEGTNGADQMHTITLLGVGLCSFSTSIFIWKLGLIFLALQLIISYSTSGWIRILQPTWRNGKDLLVVLRQHTYGNKALWNFGKDNMWFIKYSSVTILVFECISLGVVFMPINIVEIYLFFGIIFHLTNALVIGLNGFVWSFIPLFISYYWLSFQINQVLWS